MLKSNMNNKKYVYIVLPILSNNLNNRLILFEYLQSAK